VIGADGTLLVRRSSTTGNGAGQTLTAASVVIDGLLSADAQGFNAGQGPASGSQNIGGTHGGEGGGNPAATYGSVTNPIALGSGGRFGQGDAEGGGAIALDVSGGVTVNGAIGADASPYGGYNRLGAGGSIRIVAGTLEGTGTVHANGASAGTAAGGGGRIAVTLDSGTDFGSVSFEAFGGSGGSEGAAGTVYLKQVDHGTGRGEVIIDNNNEDWFPNTPYTDLSEGGDTVHAYAQVTIRNDGNLRIRAGDTLDFNAATIVGESASVATLTLAGTNGVTFPDPFTLDSNYTLCVDTPVSLPTGDWTVPSGAALSHSANRGSHVYDLDLTLNSLTIDSGGEINVDLKGFENGDGPGAPPDISSGGNHGGQGSYNEDVTCYGSVTNPTTLGSGGRYELYKGNQHGGGAVILSIADALVNNGTITAGGPDGDRTGSGGSINIRTGTLSGDGDIRANGRDGYRSGGGGRIAIRLATSTDYGSMTIEAQGGEYNNGNGAAGTVYKQTGEDEEGAGIVLVDNADIDADPADATTALPSFAGSTEDLSLTRWTIQNFGEVKLVDHVTIGGLTLSTNGYIHLNGYTGTVATLTITNLTYKYGEYTADELGSLVIDDSVGGTGRLVIPPPPQGTLFILY
jgi:large repetitive protein